MCLMVRLLLTDAGLVTDVVRQRKKERERERERERGETSGGMTLC